MTLDREPRPRSIILAPLPKQGDVEVAHDSDLSFLNDTIKTLVSLKRQGHTEVLLSIQISPVQSTPTPATRFGIPDIFRYLRDLPFLSLIGRVHSLAKGHSTILLLAVPVAVWNLLPDDPACSFSGFTTSANVLLDTQKRRTELHGPAISSFMEPHGAQVAELKLYDEDIFYAPDGSTSLGSVFITAQHAIHGSLRPAFLSPTEFASLVVFSLDLSKSNLPRRNFFLDLKMNPYRLPSRETLHSIIAYEPSLKDTIPGSNTILRILLERMNVIPTISTFEYPTNASTKGVCWEFETDLEILKIGGLRVALLIRRTSQESIDMSFRFWAKAPWHSGSTTQLVSIKDTGYQLLTIDTARSDDILPDDVDPENLDFLVNQGLLRELVCRDPVTDGFDTALGLPRDSPTGWPKGVTVPAVAEGKQKTMAADQQNPNPRHTPGKPGQPIEPTKDPKKSPSTEDPHRISRGPFF